MAADRTSLTAWLGGPTLDSAELLACRLQDRRGDWGTTHRTDEHLLVFVERGALLLVSGQRHRAESGGLLWLPPGPPRRLQAIAKPVAVRHANLRLRIPGPAPLKRLLQRRAAWDLLPLWEQLAECRSAPGRLAALRRRCLLRCLLATAAALPVGPDAERALSRPQRRLLLDLGASDAGTLTPRDLARALDLSPDYFARRFKISYGTTPRRWLLEQRLRRAAEALAEDTASVTEIAGRFGFSSVTWFCRAFRELLGCTPLAWRRRARP